MPGRMRKHFALILCLLLSLSLACCRFLAPDPADEEWVIPFIPEEENEEQNETGQAEDSGSGEEDVSPDTTADGSGLSSAEILELVPEYSGEIYVTVNDNVPYFEEDELTTEVFESYSELDGLGRCGTAYANICQELMPTEERGDISSVYPTGWVQNAYDFVDSQYVYNRAHLIAFCLAGENDNELNLITGTRTFNVEGMLPFESLVADYVDETGNHVLYRVTPVFEGDNLLATGVLMEAWSVEDDGDGVAFCAFVYNVEPGVEIDYATGENWESDETEEAA